jgi:hypothetical protein
MTSSEPLFSIRNAIIIENRGVLVYPDTWLSARQVRVGDWVKLRSQGTNLTRSSVILRVSYLDVGRWSGAGEKYLDRQMLGAILLPLSARGKVQPGGEVWTAAPEDVAAETQRSAAEKASAVKLSILSRLFRRR